MQVMAEAGAPVSGVEWKAALLRRIPLFARLDAALLQDLAGVAIATRYRPHQIIFGEGEPGRALYVLRTGRVKLSRASADGREHILHIVKGGDPIAAIPFFDGGPYPATAVVLEDTEVLLVHYDDFRTVVRKYPDLLMEMIQLLARRLRRAESHVTSLVQQDGPDRLARCLLKLASDHGRPSPQGVEITLELTREDLGKLVGLSREATSRILQRFQRQGLIGLTHRRITVHETLTA